MPKQAIAIWHRNMSQEWIKASLALDYVSEGLIDYSAKLRICERAHAGLIAAKAERIVWGGKEERERRIGKSFWWAEGHEALEQDWRAGDFSTWIDQKIEVKAFGVSFDFAALSKLVSADKQAAALRRISVIADDDWISASELNRLMAAKGGPFETKLLEACQLGKIAGRAMRARCFVRGVGTMEPDRYLWGAIEWDIPLYYWRDFATAQHARNDWRLDKFSGCGGNEHRFEEIELQGVHFHRSGLINLGLETGRIENEQADSNRGRRPKYDWPAASLHIFGLINRGDFKPECQADIEKALIGHLADGDEEPGESTVRPYAKLIWEENRKA